MAAVQRSYWKQVESMPDHATSILDRYGDFVARHYLDNRIMVSADIPGILESIERAVGLPMTVHAYPSGSDIATWVVPDQWDVMEAWLKGPDGKLVASYADHPLFVAPYSRNLHERLTKEELEPHLRLHRGLDNVYFYEHRIAYDYRLRLKDWAISLPRKTWEALPAGTYEVKIDARVAPGDMLVGEIVLPGRSDDSIAFLTDYCHPGQVNDSFSGIVVMMDVMRRLQAMKERRYTYRFYIFPETIGSSIHLHRNPALCEQVKLAIFSEFVGWGRDWLVTTSSGDGNIANKLVRQIQRAHPKVTRKHLFQGIGNDELIFDYAGIPSVSVQKTHVKEYHSSDDEPSRLRAEDLQMASDMIFRMAAIAEADTTLRRTQDVPIYLTRFDLYRDSMYSAEEFQATRAITYLIDGKRSVLDIADELALDFDFVNDFVRGLAATGMFPQV